MSPISPDDLHRIFDNLDKNKSGTVTVQALHHLLDAISIHTTLEELESFVGRPSLDYLDFLFFYESAAMPKKQEAASSEACCDHRETDDLFQAFKVFDMNGDGYISGEELQSVLSRLGLWEKRGGLDCRDMIRAYDTNSDGLLDFDEFKAMMSVKHG